MAPCLLGRVATVYFAVGSRSLQKAARSAASSKRFDGLQSMLVTDDAIRQAQAQIRKETGLVTEAGGAAALSALLSGAYQPEPGERVGVLVCGGNAPR